MFAQTAARSPTTSSAKASGARELLSTSMQNMRAERGAEGEAVASATEAQEDEGVQSASSCIAWDFDSLPLFPPQGPRPLAAPRGAIQPELEIGAVADPLEREADRVAEAVMGAGSNRAEGPKAPEKAPPSTAVEATDLIDYVALMRCAEQALGLSNREMLTMFRQLYYGSQAWTAPEGRNPVWDDVVQFPSANVGDPRLGLGMPLFDSLQASQEVGGVDVGHMGGRPARLWDRRRRQTRIAATSLGRSRSSFICASARRIRICRAISTLSHYGLKGSASLAAGACRSRLPRRPERFRTCSTVFTMTPRLPWAKRTPAMRAASSTRSAPRLTLPASRSRTAPRSWDRCRRAWAALPRRFTSRSKGAALRTLRIQERQGK
jgi:hypothetical protein